MAVPCEEKNNIDAVYDFADVNQGACARKTRSQADPLQSVSGGVRDVT